MGVKGLWQALEPELERVEGAEDGDSSGRRLARLMDGAHVAVDLASTRRPSASPAPGPCPLVHCGFQRRTRNVG